MKWLQWSIRIFNWLRMSLDISTVNKDLTSYSLAPVQTVHGTCDPDFCLFSDLPWTRQWTTQEEDNKSARFCYWFTKDRQLNRTTRNVSPRTPWGAVVSPFGTIVLCPMHPTYKSTPRTLYIALNTNAFYTMKCTWWTEGKLPRKKTPFLLGVVQIGSKSPLPK